MFSKKVFYSIVVIVGLVILSPQVSFGAEQFSRDLSFGFQQDSDVTKLQEFLSDEGLYSGPITGNFFSLTLKAIKAFQTREGITPAAGYFGPKTRVRANALLGAQIQASNQQAVVETGQSAAQSSAPQITNNSVSNVQSQLEELLKQLALLQQQVKTQQQNQTNTNTPAPTSNQITTPTSPSQNSTLPTNTLKITSENYLNVSQCNENCGLSGLIGSGLSNGIIGSYTLTSPVSEDINISEITIGIDPNFSKRLKNPISLSIETPKRLDDFGKLIPIAGQGGQLRDIKFNDAQCTTIKTGNTEQRSCIYPEIKNTEQLIFNIQEDEQNIFQIPANKNFKISMSSNIGSGIEPKNGQCIEPLIIDKDFFAYHNNYRCIGGIPYENATILRSCKAVGKSTGKIYTCNPQNINGQTITISN